MVRMPPPSVVRIALAVAAVVLVGLAATGGPVPLATEGERTPAPAVDRAAEAEPAETGAAEASTARRGDTSLVGAGVIAVVVQTALLALVVLALAATVRPLMDRNPGDADGPDDEPDEHWPLPAAELAAAVDDGLAALRAGMVDDAIIACWLGLEDAAAAAGAGRQASDTPAELAARLLAELHAPAEAIDELLRRYRQARFSHHPLDEADREVAIGALEAIRTAFAGARA